MPVKSGLMQRINQSTAYQSETGNPIYRSSCTYGYWGTESSGAANFRGSISIDNHHPGFHHAPRKVSSGHVEASRGDRAWKGGGWVIKSQICAWDVIAAEIPEKAKTPGRFPSRNSRCSGNWGSGRNAWNILFKSQLFWLKSDKLQSLGTLFSL
jgi:hypothetical protein